MIQHSKGFAKPRNHRTPAYGRASEDEAQKFIDVDQVLWTRSDNLQPREVGVSFDRARGCVRADLASARS